MGRFAAPDQSRDRQGAVKRPAGIPRPIPLPHGRGSDHRPAIAFALAAALLVPLGGCSGAVDHPEIRAVLDQQLEAWNDGDIEGFVAHYWKSDELVFKSPKGETRGWQAVLQRYRRAYPTPEKMGSLTFDLGEIVRPSDDTAEVAGQYRVRTANEIQTGRFYLHFRKINDAWLIVRDYTVGD